MKRIFSILIVLISCTTLSRAQKTINDANAEKRTVGSFHGIHVSTGIKLILTEGSSEEVAVSAAKNEYRDKIETEVVGGILRIHYQTEMGAINNRKEKKELKAYVSYKKLDELKVNTGAEVDIEGVLRATKMKMEVHTGGEISGQVDIDELVVDQSTGSKVEFSGEADKLEVDGDTGSKFNGFDLKTSHCSVTASTGAGVHITVNKELNVKANTGGYVKYKGEAGIREVKTNSGGQVTKI